MVDPVNGRLIVEPEKGTDFWQTTHYGFQVDNGHLLAAQVTGDFVITIRFISMIKRGSWCGFHLVTGSRRPLNMNWATRAGSGGRDESWLLGLVHPSRSR